MSEETYVQLMWCGIIVLGFGVGLITAAAIIELVRRGLDYTWPEWDWTADQKRRITDLGRKSDLGISQNTRRSL